MRTQTLVGAAKLSMLEAGPANGPAIVLLHGIPASAELWRGTAELLGQAGFHAYALDLPGYGSTRLPKDGDCSLAGAAELIARWLSEIRIGPVWLVGHDLGGGVAQILFARHPQLLQRLTLANSIVEDQWPTPPIRMLRAAARSGLYNFLATGKMIANFYGARALKKAFADPRRLTADLRARVFWDGKITDPDGRNEFVKHLVSLDEQQIIVMTSGIPTARIPILLLWGGRDIFLPWETMGKRLLTHFPDAKTVVLDDSGHFPMLEQPHAFVTSLIDWQRQTPSTGQS